MVGIQKVAFVLNKPQIMYDQTLSRTVLVV